MRHGPVRQHQTRAYPNIEDASMSGYTLNKIAGTFGAIQIGAHDQTVIIEISARNYDTTGHLRSDHAHLRLPLNDAIRLHATLAGAIVAAETTDPRQPGLWSYTEAFGRVS